MDLATAYRQTTVWASKEYARAQGVVFSMERRLLVKKIQDKNVSLLDKRTR